MGSRATIAGTITMPKPTTDPMITQSASVEPGTRGGLVESLSVGSSKWHGEYRPY